LRSDDCRIPCSIILKALETFPQKKVPSILFGLGQEWQQNIAKIGSDVTCFEELQRIREIDHLGDGWGFFEGVVPEGQ
jgi:hypothetical protein